MQEAGLVGFRVFPKTPVTDTESVSLYTICQGVSETERESAKLIKVRRIMKNAWVAADAGGIPDQ
jgi:hypothetical protein